jgi:hypothetical protein
MSRISIAQKEFEEQSKQDVSDLINIVLALGKTIKNQPKIKSVFLFECLYQITGIVRELFHNIDPENKEVCESIVLDIINKRRKEIKELFYND